MYIYRTCRKPAPAQVTIRIIILHYYHIQWYTFDSLWPAWNQNRHRSSPSNSYATRHMHMCDMIHSCVLWLSHMWHDSFVCDTAQWISYLYKSSAVTCQAHDWQHILSGIWCWWFQGTSRSYKAATCRYMHVHTSTHTCKHTHTQTYTCTIVTMTITVCIEICCRVCVRAQVHVCVCVCVCVSVLWQTIEAISSKDLTVHRHSTIPSNNGHAKRSLVSRIFVLLRHLLDTPDVPACMHMYKIDKGQQRKRGRNNMCVSVRE